MIDLHCHILPGLDDGAAKGSDTLKMCRMAAEDGITHVVATPHIHPSTPYVSMDAVKKLCNGLNSILERQGIPLTVLPGGEVALTPDLVKRAKDGSLHTLCDNGRYFFLELADAQPGKGLEDIIFEMKLQGITPIIAHPERTGAQAPSLDWIVRLVELGCLSQITAMSLTGDLGKPIAKICEQMLDRNLAHLVATDAHSPSWRPPLLSKAQDRLADLLGQNQADLILIERPQSIIEGQELEIPRPTAKRNWWRFSSG